MFTIIQFTDGSVKTVTNAAPSIVQEGDYSLCLVDGHGALVSHEPEYDLSDVQQVTFVDRRGRHRVVFPNAKFS